MKFLFINKKEKEPMLKIQNKAQNKNYINTHLSIGDEYLPF